MTKVKSRILINLAYSQRLQYTALKVIYILLVCIFSGYIFAFLVLKMWELSFKQNAAKQVRFVYLLCRVFSLCYCTFTYYLISAKIALDAKRSNDQAHE